MAAIAKSTYTANESGAESTANDFDTAKKESAVKLRVLLLKLQCDWSGDSKEAAIKAAMEFGKLVASQMLDFETTADELRKLFVAKKVDESHWEDVSETFEKVSSLPLTENYSLQECFPAHANDNDEPENEQKLTSDVTLSDLTDPGGVVSNIVDWIVSSASRPSRELALSATLPFVGALIGRRFASDRDLRTNFYAVALAGSGYGKEHARSQLQLLIEAAGLGAFEGPTRFMSASGLRSAVLAKPSCICMIDEFAALMRQINDKNGGIHNTQIRSDLLEMFTRAHRSIGEAAYAKGLLPKIYNPNLCLYGTSTPEDFWASVSSLNAVDGLLPRFMLFNITGKKPGRVVPNMDVFDVPQSLIDAVQALALAGRGKGDIANLNLGSMPCKPIIVPYSADAATELEKFEAFIEEKETVCPTKSHPILYRAIEQAIRLALTVSVATNHAAPVITGHAMKWAVKLAWLSTCTMIEETGDRIADNQLEADKNRIFGHIKRAGKKGITEGKIVDRCGSIDPKRRAGLLSDLVLASRIKEQLVSTDRRPRKRYFLVG
jgi:hypothetical protein